MSWASISGNPNEWVSDANLQDAIVTGVFSWAGTAIPANNRYVIKSNISSYVNIVTTNSYLVAKAANQWLAVRDLTPITSPTIAIYGQSLACVDPNSKIAISKTKTKLAKNIKAGDLVYTKHETTGKYGKYKVLSAAAVNQPKFILETEKAILICSGTHRLFTDKWVSVSDLYIGDEVEIMGGVSKVLSITQASSKDTKVIEFNIDEAHTYIANGILSHNKSGIAGWSSSSAACSAGATAYTANIYYAGTLSVGSHITTSQAVLSAPTSTSYCYYYYSGGYLQITLDVSGGTGLYVSALGTCVVPVSYPLSVYNGSVSDARFFSAVYSYSGVVGTAIASMSHFMSGVTAYGTGVGIVGTNTIEIINASSIAMNVYSVQDAVTFASISGIGYTNNGTADVIINLSGVTSANLTNGILVSFN